MEIGPGRGALTSSLADAGARVLAIEVDRGLAAHLEQRAHPGVRVLVGDVLTLNLVRIMRELAAEDERSATVRLVGNLPYNISAPILLQVLRAHDAGAPIGDAVLMFQREVAERVTAQPGSQSYGPLAVLTALRAATHRRLKLPPGAFRPAPSVHSAVVELRFRRADRMPSSLALFELMVRTLFTQRRKQCVNALAPLAHRRGTQPAGLLRAAGIDGRRRPGELKLSELIDLAEVLGDETT